MNDDPFERHMKRIAAQRAALRKITPVDLYGVIDESGPGGVSFGSRWDLVIHLGVWRIADGPVQWTELRTEMPLAKEKLLDEWMYGPNSLDAYDLVHMKARVLLEKEKGGPIAMVDAIINRKLADPILAAAAAELRQPVTIEDPTFGTLTLQRAYHWFEGQAKWQRRKVKLALRVGKDSTSPEKAIVAARQLWGSSRKWHTALMDSIVRDLLPTYNERWRNERAPVLDASSFVAPLRLTTIEVSADGELAFWLDDGKLFGDHAIWVRGSLQQGVGKATLAG